jgi:hypothetical protein
MSLKTLKEELRNQIAIGQTPSVLADLMTLLSQDSDYHNDIYTLQGNYKSLEKQYINRTIGDAEYRTENTKLAHALLLLIDNLTDDDLKKVNISELEKGIAALKLAPQPPIKLVDCDRGTQYTAYSDAFRKLRKSAYQFFFITAQTPDQPAHFAERIVHEIKARTKDSVTQAIDFPHRVCGVTGTERVDFPELPFDDWSDLAENQTLFRTYFEERMRKFGLEKIQIEEFVTVNTQRLPYRYFMFLFRINFDKYQWIPELTEYLLWMINTFKANPSSDPMLTFQIAFIIDSNTANVNDNKTIASGIEHILRGVNDADNQPAFWLKDFTPVPITDLTGWFTHLTKGQFQPQIKHIIAHATAGLDNPTQPFMADLEQLFFTVYNVSQGNTD